MHAPDQTARPTDLPPQPQTMRARTLNAHSLRGFRRLFITLPLPDDARLDGIFRAEFVGPGWLRAIGPHSPGLGRPGRMVGQAVRRGWSGHECGAPGRHPGPHHARAPWGWLTRWWTGGPVWR